FSTDAPTLVIRDTEWNSAGSSVWTKIADIDGDHGPDLLLGGDYGGVHDTMKIKMYFSSHGSPWNWSRPDRVLPIVPYIPFADSYISLHDVNGDGVADIAGSVYSGYYAGVYLW